jgi:hypothetical protein
VEKADEDTASHTVTGEVRAFCERNLRRAVDSVLRAISAASALSEAVLEARAVRVASPSATPATALEVLARDLRDAGFPVSFGRFWAAANDAGICVGTGGDPGFREFLGEHPTWGMIL